MKKSYYEEFCKTIQRRITFKKWKQMCSFSRKNSMTRKYHNHTLQTKPRHYEEVSQNSNSNKISRRKRTRSLSLSLFLVKTIETSEWTPSTKHHITKQGQNHTKTNQKQNKKPRNNGSNNKQSINNDGTIALEGTAAGATRGPSWRS